MVFIENIVGFFKTLISLLDENKKKNPNSCAHLSAITNHQIPKDALAPGRNARGVLVTGISRYAQGFFRMYTNFV